LRNFELRLVFIELLDIFRLMNRIEKTLLALVFAGLSYSSQALTAENRYDTIVDRNVFRLNPMPVVTAPTNTDPVLDRKVDLSGISNVGGHKKAWFVVAPKAGSKDLPLYLNLSEGQRQDFLEVVSITESEGEVKVLNAGNSMVLSLKNNSLKAQPVAPMPPTPGVAPVAHAATPSATPQPTTASYGSSRSAYGNSSSYANGNSSYGNRGAVTVSGGSPVTTAGSGQPVESGGLRSIPTRTLRLAPAPSQQPAVDPLTQRVMMEVQQEQAKQSGQQLPPLPPLPQ
jgi:hypothetical protein